MITFGRQNRVLCSTVTFVALFALFVAATPIRLSAQKLNMPGEATQLTGQTPVSEVPFGVDTAGAEVGPSTVQSYGTVYNPATGSHIRARYNTRSYGQEQGNLDLGTMKHWDFGGGVSFFDGQVTLNEESHVGYNLGLGYRWLTLPLMPNSPDNQKIMGVSLWADGQGGGGGGNFFPQVGVSLEFLGDHLDFRANGYAPVGPRSQTRDFSATGDRVFTGNFIADELVGVRDTALTVGEVEVAGRIQDYDAWVFGGVYGFQGGAFDGTGGMLGLRGYATPDLALSIKLTNDDVFDTNAVFSATWFIGRTRRENCPSGTLKDRFREPVIRNDYVALAQSTAFSTSNPLRDVDNELIRVVHIDSTSAGGGDGTFENPFDQLADAGGAGSQEGDILLAHAGSTFADDSIRLQDNQRLLGEGIFDNNDTLVTNTNIDHTVTVFGGSTVSLPETATGSFAVAAPTVTNTAATDAAVILADANEVNNLVFSGGTHAITSDLFDPNGAGTNGAGDPTLRNLHIASTTGNAIELNAALRTDATTAAQSLEMNVDIDNVFLTDITGPFGILIDGEDGGFGDAAAVTVNESIDIDNVSVTGGTAVGIGVQNTNTTTTPTTITDYGYDGGTTGAGALALDAVTGTVTLDGDSSLTGGATTGTGILVKDSTAAVTIASTVTIDDVNGTTIHVDGDSLTSGGGGVTEGSVTVNANITNDDGLAVEVDGLSEDATVVAFNGTINSSTDAGSDAEGISVHDNAGGEVQFFDNVTLNTGANPGVSLNNNGAAGETTIDFGPAATLAITTAGATGFSATNGGTVIVQDGTSTISSTGAEGLVIEDATIGTPDVNFQSVTASGGTNGIRLDNLTGGTVTIGAANNAASAGGTISGTTGDGVVLTNVENVALNGVSVNNSTQKGVEITHNASATTGMTVALDTVQVDGGTIGIQANGESGDQAGEPFSLTMTDSSVTNTVTGIDFNGTEGTVVGTNVDVSNTTATGIRSFDSGANITLDSTSSVTGAAGTGIEVDNGSPSFLYNGSLTNTAGRAVIVSDLTGGLTSFTFEGGLNDTGTGILVNNVADGAVSFAASGANTNTITTLAGNNAIDITNTAGGTLMFDDFALNTVDGHGVNATTNTNGIVFFTDTAINVTGTGDGLHLDNAVGSDFDPRFNGLQVTTTSGTGVSAVGSWLSVGAATNPNSIDTTTGVALAMTDVGVNSGVDFATVNVTAGATNAVNLTRVGTGPVVIGTNNGTDGGGGTLTTAGSAVVLTDAASFTISDVAIAASGNPAFDLNSTDANDSSVTINNVQTPAGLVTAIDADQTGTGNLSVAVNDSELNSTTGDAVTFDGVDGTVNVNNTEINDGTGRGVVITNGDGTYAFDSQTTLNNQTGDALTVDGGEGTVTYNGTITNTAARSVLVQNKTAGGVAFGPTSTITDSGTGILVDSNSGGSYDFLGTNDLDTTTNDAVTVTNNTGSQVSFAGLDVVTTTGAGFTATGGGTLSVLGGSNTVETTTGTGVTIDSMTISNTGAEFNSVTVDGAANGLLLNDLTGGRVTVNGGTMTTTGNAIDATNVAGLTVEGVTVTSAGADAVSLVNNDTEAMDVTINNLTVTAATGLAVNADHTGDGAFDLRLNNSTLADAVSVAASGNGAFDLFSAGTSITTGADLVGFDLNLSGTLSDADISFDTVNIDTNNNIAFNFDTSGSSKDVRFLMQNSTTVNNGAGFEAFDGGITGTTRLDATIDSNTFTNNAGGGEPFNLLSDGSNVTTELNLSGNTATTGSLTLDVQNGATFDVFDVTNASANNGNDVAFNPAIGSFGDFAGTVEQPVD